MIAVACRLAAVFLIAWLAFATTGVATDEGLARAKALYLSAAYIEALTVLDQLQSDSSAPAQEAIEVAEYRAFCLLALERRDDARKVIETIVTADPFYQLPEGRAAPRVQAVFRETRRQLFPTIVRQSYADAKTAFERKDAGAAAKFDRVLELLDDPDARAVPAMADLRTVAAGFRDLSKSANPGSVQAVAPVPAEQGPSAADVRDESDVVPAVPLFQQLPPWTSSTGSTLLDQNVTFKGTLELLIDRSGNVASVRLQKNVHPRYDAELLKAALTWKYKPATKNGTPTEYVKFLNFQLVAKP